MGRKQKRPAPSNDETSKKKKVEKDEDDIDEQLKMMRENFKGKSKPSPSTTPSKAANGGGGGEADEDSWSDIDGGDLMVYKRKGVAPSSKIAAYDIDGTIITTKSGKVFPVNIDDWQILYPEIPGKLKQLHKDGYKIVFITNQLGIAKGKLSRKDFKRKVEAISSKINIPVQCLVSIGKGAYRKPAIGMWEYLTRQDNGGVEIDVAGSMYVGDAAGRPVNWQPKKKKDFSNSDRLFALNIGIPFYTPEEHFQGKKPAPFDMPVFNPADTLKLKPYTKEFIESLSRTKPEVIVMVGLPGSGKSYFFKQYLEKKNYVHANRDTVGSWQKCVGLIKKHIPEGKSVVIDNTNPDVESRKRYIDAAKELKTPVRCFVFTTTLEHAKHNNKFRELTDTNHERVSDMVYNMYKSKYTEPVTAEGFSEILKVDFIPKFTKDADQKLYQMYLMEK